VHKSCAMRIFWLQNMADLVPGAGVAAIDLISTLCSWDPNRRPPAAQALSHPYFQVICIHHGLRGKFQQRTPTPSYNRIHLHSSFFFNAPHHGTITCNSNFERTPNHGLAKNVYFESNTELYAVVFKPVGSN
jgi:serine/threonine protein kinase